MEPSQNSIPPQLLDARARLERVLEELVPPDGEGITLQASSSSPSPADEARRLEDLLASLELAAKVVSFDREAAARERLGLGRDYACPNLEPVAEGAHLDSTSGCRESGRATEVRHMRTRTSALSPLTKLVSLTNLARLTKLGSEFSGRGAAWPDFAVVTIPLLASVTIAWGVQISEFLKSFLATDSFTNGVLASVPIVGAYLIGSRQMLTRKRSNGLS